MLITMITRCGTKILDNFSVFHAEHHLIDCGKSMEIPVSTNHASIFWSPKYPSAATSLRMESQRWISAYTAGCSKRAFRRTCRLSRGTWKAKFKKKVQHLALASPESQDLVFLSEHLGENP